MSTRTLATPRTRSLTVLSAPLLAVALVASAHLVESLPRLFPTPSSPPPSGRAALQAGAPGVDAVTLTFREGVSAYAGTVDTFVNAGAPGTSQTNAVTLVTDLGPTVQQTLLRFDGIFGSGPGQIPPGSTITSASLTLNVTNDSGVSTPAGARLHRLLQTWNESDTWNTLGTTPWNASGGIQADGAEAVATADASPTVIPLGTQTLDVTASLQSWLASPGSNFGWALLPPAVDDSLQFSSSEATTVTSRPLLSVTFDPPPVACEEELDCADGNPCTEDLCDLGTSVCSNPALSCPAGESCNPGTGLCEAGPVTVSFKQGVGGYASTFDTFLAQATPDADNGAATSLSVDGDPARHILLRFEGIFGSTTGKIPPGSTIQSATLRLQIDNASATGASFHRMLGPWSESDSWSTFGGNGIQADGNEAAATSDASSFLNSTGSHDVTVTGSLATWSAGAVNHGWALLANGTDSWGILSSESATPPELIVVYLPPASCALDADCDDGNPCTDDTCNPGTGFCDRLPDDSNACSDGASCTDDTCDGGRCLHTDTCLPPAVCDTQADACGVPPTPPAPPANPSPGNGATGVPVEAELCVDVSDANGGALDVTFHGREQTTGGGEDFTIVVLPDTQLYSQSFPATWNAQTQWIRDNRVSRNIVFVSQLGDCVNNGDTAGQEFQWTNASAAIDLLESAPGLPDGIPYGIAVGNHDNGGSARAGSNEGATTIQYTKHLGLQRACPGTCSNAPAQACEKDADCTSPGICNPGATCKSYFGGRYDFGDPVTYFRNTDNHYELFSASGMDFIFFHLEWDCADGSMGCQSPGVAHPTRQLVLNWVDDLVTNVYPNRRAVISAHHLLSPSGSPPAFSNQGQALYNTLQDNPNVFMTLCGHLDQANRRRDEPQPGHVIHSMISDYQTRPNGGNGWLRILTFHPQTDTIDVETYSPTLGQFIDTHPDNASTAQNRFTLDYDMDDGGPFSTLATESVAGTPPSPPSAATQVCTTWSGLQPGTTYDWYASVSDGTATVTGPTQSFTTTTTCSLPEQCDDGNPCTDDACVGGTCQHDANAGPCADDGNACTDDVCAAGACTHPANSLPCADDANSCTLDLCSGGACTHPADPSGTCDDGNACTTGDACSAGACEALYVPDAQDCCEGDADCDDDDPGTTDQCAGAPAGDCSNVENQTCTVPGDCDDGDACTTDGCDVPNAFSLRLDGADDYVTMGTAPGLGASSFTLELWFKWEGAGVATSTGTGGTTLYPLIAKGAPEADDTNVDANYVLGIRSTGAAVLAADFEEGVGGTDLGLNHPIAGTTTITPNVWHHGAVTYDGTCWQLFLDGVQETLSGTACPAQPVRSDSIQHFGLGAALTSTGARNGAFHGYLDEARVWNRVLTPAEIATGMSEQILTGTGLLGRWGLEEGTGAVAADSAAPAQNGTLTGGPTWSTDRPNLGTGICTFTPIPGCTPCDTSADCDDGDACTTDSCTGGSCQYGSVTCDDGNPCTDDSCDAGLGCVFTPDAGNGCDDLDVCNGAESCDAAGVCQPGTGLDCDDAVACTTDTCSPTLGCQHASNCGAGQACNLGTGTCQDSCIVAAECDDGDACTTDVCDGASAAALLFDGSNDYVTMGGTTALAAAEFTVEAWIQWNGGGATASSGTGGITAVPIVAKGVGESEAATLNANYFFGIVSGSNVLGADFEEHSTGTTIGLNHPVTGTTGVTSGVWHHVAVTYGGGCWQLYLDGVPDTSGTNCPNQPPDFASIQHFGIGAALSSTGVRAGAFPGRIDEVRLWNRALSPAEIAAGKDLEVTSGTGLIGRWDLDEGTGTTAADSAAPAQNGTLTGGPTWSVADRAPIGPGSCQNEPVPGCCLVNADCDDADSCTVDTCVSGTCEYAFDSGAACDDGNPGTCNDTCVSSLVISRLPAEAVEDCLAGTSLSFAAGQANPGFTATNLTWTHNYAPITAPIVSATLTVDIGDADSYVMSLLAQGSVAIGTITGGDNGGPGAWACPDAWANGADNVISIPSSLFADLADGSFQVSTTGGGVSPPGQYGINRSILQIQVAGCAGTTVGCCTLDEECDDGNACTSDACVTGVCQNAYVPDAQDCCDDDGDCDDGDPGTTDQCTGAPGGDCSNVQIQTCSVPGDCDDGDVCTTDDCDVANATSLRLDGVDDYVTMGVAPGLNASVFTLELWFKWDGGGAGTTTGTGGTNLYPLIAKGAPQAENSNFDANYVFGIRSTGAAVLAADFEEGATGASPGLNHPIEGTTTITPDVWYHAAVTYDGTCWKLYLNGVEETLSGTACPAQPVRADSIQHFGLGAALTSAGARNGAFEGWLDEARVWNRVLTPAEILAGRNEQLSSGMGLLGRWGLEEGAGTAVGDSTVPAENGTLTGNPTWSTDRPVLGTGICSFTPIPGCTPCSVAAECDDGDACTTEACTGGVCQYGAVSCDDSNPCTDDACDAETGCISSPSATGTSCSDGDPCNGDEVCDGAGACLPGTPPTCDDGLPCTDDVCTPGVGCVFTPDDTNICADSNLCNGTETCQAGVCQAGSVLDCDDGNACTDDSCVPATGCAHGNNADPCDDGNVCTSGDVCSAGTCGGTGVPGCCTTDVQCDDGNTCTVDYCPTAANPFSLRLDGVDDFVTMGTAPGLGASAFTLELWFKWQGAGVATSTGTGGTNLYPLLTKGAPEADGSNLDANYVLGIRSTGAAVLAADFEEGAGGASPGLNHPIAGTTTITPNVWHHAAVTYDGTCWKLFLDGVEEALSGTACPGQPVRSDSIQRFGLGAAITSTGARNGAFQGWLDEARVWTRVLTAAEIQGNRFRTLTSGTNLAGRWGLDEAAGTSVLDSTTPAENGTLTNGGTRETDVAPLAAPNTCVNQPVSGGGCCLTAADCDDGNACTDDACSAGQCQYANNSGPCDDGDACTAPDACSAGSCGGTPIPGCISCTTDAQCDDGNDCTTDVCDTANDAALSFPGSAGNRLQFPVGAGLDYLNDFGTGSFTIEGWVHTDGGAVSLTGIFRGGRQGAFSQVAVQLTGTGNRQIAGSVETNVTGTQVDVVGPQIPLNIWTHFALVVDRAVPASSQLRIYVNGGAPTTTTTSLWASNPVSFADPSVLGAARDASGNLINPFDGRLDEVRIWNHVRTHAQIAADMNREIVAAPGLVHRWGLNEGGGATTADSVGSATGTLTAATWSTTSLAPFGDDTCAYTNVAGGTSCSDGSVCTSGETCDGSGVCGGGISESCDDSDLCTIDTCDPETGCANTPVVCPVGEACDPSDGVCKPACTPTGPDTDCDGVDDDCDGTNDEDYVSMPTTCGVGACASTGTTSCVTGSVEDSCVAGTATPETCNGVDDDCDGTPDDEGAALCDDGSACTTDVCIGAGGCSNAPIACDDANPCTDDGCDPGTGCTFVPDTGNSCSDGDVCNGVESCSAAGACSTGTPLACDDGNDCNGLETCHPLSGCAAGTPPAASTQLVVSDQTFGEPGSTVVVPVLALPAQGVALDLRLTWDPAVLQAVTVEKTAISQDAALAFDLGTPGLAVVSLVHTQPFVGTGAIVEVTFLVVGAAGEGTALDLIQGSIDEGTISSCLDDGLLGVCAGVPGEVTGLALQGTGVTALTWTDQGAGVQYDIATGTLSALHGGGGVFDAACLESGVGVAGTTDVRPAPPAMDGYYYLIRGRTACARGTYGAAGNGEERIALRACP